MTEVTAQIGDVHGPTTTQSQSFTRAQMGEMYINPAELEPPRYQVYLYSVSKREHVVQQAPLIPYLIIPACGDDEAYKKVISIPHPMLQIERHPDKSEAIVYRHEAERVAQSICNPDNPTLDQDYQNPKALGWGVDLSKQGVFWSKNDPPTKEEIGKAHARVEKYYAQLLERARTLEIANPKELELLINQDFHLACEHFGVETSWHKKLVANSLCPVCREPVKFGAAYHKNSMEILCVIDWQRTVTAGVKTKKDVPEDARWWTDAK